MAEPTFKAIPYEQLSADRKAIAETNAKAQGFASGKEYIESRGGVNRAGYYGDSYQEGITLTDEEYSKALESAKASGKTGAGLGAAINAASQAKLKTYYESQGYSPEEIEGLIDGTLSISPSGTIINTGFASTNVNNSGNADSATGFGPGSKGYDDRKSAYDLLYSQFAQYGLGSLVEPLKGLIMEGVSPSEFTLRLRETDAYKKRFAANQTRINQGLRALSEAEYIGLEDSYQDIMRRYGLPESYYARGDMGIQQGFEKFIGNDVSPVELEDRIQTAQNRVNNAPKQVKDALTQFYGAELGNGDILAYVLDPSKAIENIKRKVTAAEIGAGASMAGLGSTRTRAEELASFGVTGEQARQGFSSIAEFLPSATKLSQIYGKQGLGDYDQAVAEQEVFGTTGAAQAAAKRKKLAQLETAEFSGSSGITGGALARERAGQF